MGSGRFFCCERLRAADPWRQRERDARKMIKYLSLTTVYTNRIAVFCWYMVCNLLSPFIHTPSCCWSLNFSINRRSQTSSIFPRPYSCSDLDRPSLPCPLKSPFSSTSTLGSKATSVSRDARFSESLARLTRYLRFSWMGGMPAQILGQLQGVTVQFTMFKRRYNVDILDKRGLLRGVRRARQCK